MSQINYYSAEGLQKLKDELHDLTHVQRPSISNQIAEARDKGDLSENAEYDEHLKQLYTQQQAKTAKEEAAATPSKIRPPPKSKKPAKNPAVKTNNPSGSLQRNERIRPAPTLFLEEEKKAKIAQQLKRETEKATQAAAKVEEERKAKALAANVNSNKNPLYDKRPQTLFTQPSINSGSNNENVNFGSNNENYSYERIGHIDPGKPSKAQPQPRTYKRKQLPPHILEQLHRQFKEAREKKKEQEEKDTERSASRRRSIEANALNTNKQISERQQRENEENRRIREKGLLTRSQAHATIAQKNQELERIERQRITANREFRDRQKKIEAWSKSMQKKIQENERKSEADKEAEERKADDEEAARQEKAILEEQARLDARLKKDKEEREATQRKLNSYTTPDKRFSSEPRAVGSTADTKKRPPPPPVRGLAPRASGRYSGGYKTKKLFKPKIKKFNI